MAKMSVKGHGKGHVIKIYGIIGKVLSEETHMPNIKVLSLKVKTYKQTKKCDRRTDGRRTK